MPRSYGRLIATGDTVVVEGLVPLQRALRYTEDRADKHLKKQIREAAEPIKRQAQANAPVRSGALRKSIKIGVNRGSVSVYSNLVYSLVQEEGGRVGRNHATLLTRGNASHYMKRAVTARAGEFKDAMDDVLDAFGADFEKG